METFPACITGYIKISYAPQSIISQKASLYLEFTV